MALRPHPAKFNNELLAQIDKMLPKEGLLLDPFVGSGRIHEIGRNSFGVEIEPEWAGYYKRSLIGDSQHLPFADETFDMACTSCVYPNRMTDHHNNMDLCKKCEGDGCKYCLQTGKSKRYTYKYFLNRDLNPNNAGQMGWKSTKERIEYVQLHMNVWDEVFRTLKPNAPFLLNISNHMVKDEEINVISRHDSMLRLIGFIFSHSVGVPTKRMKDGANRDNRVETEQLRLYRKPNV